MSHDRHLIEACADRLWLVADGEVTPFEGDLDDYRRQVLGERGAAGKGDGRREEASRAAGGTRAGPGAAAEKRIELAPLRRRLSARRSAGSGDQDRQLGAEDFRRAP